MLQIRYCVTCGHPWTPTISHTCAYCQGTLSLTSTSPNDSDRQAIEDIITAYRKQLSQALNDLAG